MLSSDPTTSDPLLAWGNLWAEFFREADSQGKAMLECMAVFSDPRTARARWLEFWSSALDGYLRSPAFLESMRAGLEIMKEVKTHQNRFLHDFSRQAGVPLASDLQELAEGLRRNEEALLAHLKAIENRLANIEKRHDASQESD